MDTDMFYQKRIRSIRLAKAHIHIQRRKVCSHEKGVYVSDRGRTSFQFLAYNVFLSKTCTPRGIVTGLQMKTKGQEVPKFETT